jgi:glutathione S-transferase
MVRPELVSFDLCPFVQRSVIVLREKGIDFDITYIDLADPPGWFRDISPLGKVPLLRVGEEVLFESAVIMEYLDEITPPPLQPADPLLRAKNRAWSEFASGLLMASAWRPARRSSYSWPRCWPPI